MSKAKLRAATVGGSADDIEAAFYDALQKGDEVVAASGMVGKITKVRYDDFHWAGLVAGRLLRDGIRFLRIDAELRHRPHHSPAIDAALAAPAADERLGLRIAQAYDQSGRYAEAVDAFDRWIADHPRSRSLADAG